MLTVFIYAHCVYICSLFIYMPIVFIYAHCDYICSLSLDMPIVFIYAHYDCICPLCLYMLLLIGSNCFVEPPLLVLLLLQLLSSPLLLLLLLLLLSSPLLVLLLLPYCYYCYPTINITHVHCLYMFTVFLYMPTVFI